MANNCQETNQDTYKEISTCAKNYTTVTNKLRKALIKRVIKQDEPISKAANELNINYSTAKSIIRIYRESGRADKIPHKRRNRDKLIENLSIEDISFQESRSGQILQANVRRSTRSCKKQVKYSESDVKDDFFDEEEFEEVESVSSKAPSVKESEQPPYKICRIRALNIKKEENEQTFSECNVKSEFDEKTAKEFIPKVEEAEIKREHFEIPTVAKKVVQSLYPPVFKPANTFTNPVVFINPLEFAALLMENDQLLRQRDYLSWECGLLSKKPFAFM